MEIRLPVHGALHKGYIVLKATCKKDDDLVLKLFRAKTVREGHNRKEFYIRAHLSLPHQRRTYKQNNSVWKLVTAIFESMESRAPLEEEKTALYYDLLEVYADKIPNRFNNAFRPVHISEANSVEGSRFIDGLLSHLATRCELDYGTQATVQSVLEEWEEWKGRQETDPSDYQDIGCTQMLTYAEWVEKHPYSEAGGRGGQIVRAHIVSRGADTPDIERAWNWMALLWEEHEEQHRIGWEAFLQIYPHLRGRVERARKLAGKIELEFKSSQKVMRKSENLAMESLKGQ